MKIIYDHHLSQLHNDLFQPKDQTLHSPTEVMLTLALLPAPKLLTGTQVYSPSSFTQMLNTPELLLPIRLPLKYK